MAKAKKPAKPKITAGHMDRVLRRHINYMTKKLIPEASIPFVRGRDSYRADYILMSQAGYATEFEIKISMSDWKADLKKPKWDQMPDWINQFIYVVPEHLGIPDWIPDFAGVWHVHGYVGTIDARVTVARAPKKRGKTKAPQELIDKWMYNLYFRYWSLRANRDKVLPKL